MKNCFQCKEFNDQYIIPLDDADLYIKHSVDHAPCPFLDMDIRDYIKLHRLRYLTIFSLCDAPYTKRAETYYLDRDTLGRISDFVYNHLKPSNDCFSVTLFISAMIKSNGPEDIPEVVRMKFLYMVESEHAGWHKALMAMRLTDERCQDDPVID